MKPLHEVGIIREKDELAGAVLKKGGVYDLTPYLVCDRKQFIHLLKMNQVQYLIWDNNNDNIDVQYSQEEMAVISNIGYKPPMTVEEYFNNDCIFRARYIDLIFEGKIYVKIMGMVELPVVGEALQIMLIANKDDCGKIYNELAAMFNRTIYMNMMRFGLNNITFFMNIQDFKQWLSKFEIGKCIIDYYQVNLGLDMYNSQCGAQPNIIKEMREETMNKLKDTFRIINRKTLRSENK